MATPLLDIEGTGTEIAVRISGFADQRVHVIVLPASTPPEFADSRPISESLAEIAARVKANGDKTV
jgi:hypothetical protein